MWKELEKRCEIDSEEELDINPNEVVTFVAEIVGEQDGQLLYCTTCWTPFMPDIYAFEVTKERVFDYLVDLDLEDDGELDRIRRESVFHGEIDEEYEGPFAEQFRLEARMISDRALEAGYRIEAYDSSDDLDDM